MPGNRDPELRAGLILAALALPMAVPTAFKLLGHNGGFLRDLGFLSPGHGTVWAWALALTTTICYTGFAARNIPYVRMHLYRISPLKLAAVFAALPAAVVEEAVFRRVVMDAVREAGGGAPLELMASAAAFGAPHGIFGLIRGSGPAALRAMLATGIMGFLLGAVYLAGERSLAPCIMAHFLITLGLEPGLMLAAVTNSWKKIPADPGGEQ